MRWKRYQLADDDPRARKHILGNLSTGAHDYTLSKGLLNRFATSSGPVFLIAMESLDLDAIEDYQYAPTYDNGKLWYQAASTFTFPDGASPRTGLSDFVGTYLRSTDEAAVLLECGCRSREQMAFLAQTESRLLLFGEELYCFLSHTNDNRDFIEAAIRESDSGWLTGICSPSLEIPAHDVSSTTFFDSIVGGTAHIFSTALDGEGYLVWTPSPPKS